MKAGLQGTAWRHAHQALHPAPPPPPPSGCTVRYRQKCSLYTACDLSPFCWLFVSTAVPCVAAGLLKYITKQHRSSPSAFGLTVRTAAHDRRHLPCQWPEGTWYFRPCSSPLCSKEPGRGRWWLPLACWLRLHQTLSGCPRAGGIRKSWYLLLHISIFFFFFESSESEG